MQIGMIPKIPYENSLIVVTEPVGDVALILGQMMRMNLPEILDRHILKYGKHRKLSWGWTYLLTLSVRVLTLLEFVVRHFLQADNSIIARSPSRKSEEKDG